LPSERQRHHPVEANGMARQLAAEYALMHHQYAIGKAGNSSRSLEIISTATFCAATLLMSW
jgi:hypothetical protein